MTDDRHAEMGDQFFHALGVRKCRDNIKVAFFHFLVAMKRLKNVKLGIRQMDAMRILSKLTLGK